MSNEERVAKSFPDDVRDHKMTVVHADGVHRYVRFKRPDNGFHWFDIVTWPGCLAIQGDMGCFVFSRVHDMFTFFRADKNRERTINPRYWAEKLQAVCRHGHEQDSRAEFDVLVKRLVDEHIEAHIDEWGIGKKVEFRREVQEDVHDYFTWNHWDARSGIERLMEFKYDGQNPFHDAWDYGDCKEWTYQYLWCCHAIVWAIQQFDKRPRVVITMDQSAARVGIGLPPDAYA